MSHIDERIVKMTFDNKSFESGISKTLQSLEKLNQVLKNTGNTDAVNNLSKSMKDIKSQLSTLNLDELDKITQKQSIWQKFGNVLSSVGKGIGNLFGKLDIGGSVEKIASSFNKATDGSQKLDQGVGAVTKSFSALSIMGATALANITNKMVNLGTNLAKSLTIEPIMTGFSEYETKMGSIQTILTNTSHLGTTMEDVTKVLNDLNQYSDQTIYNFAEMTRNIGTFTAAGIDLDTSAAAIKGIANLAAASGSSSQQASTAMYQLSQALAAGRVSLADWNSVVNAGMGGKLFQDALIRTSEQLGTGAEAMIKKYGSFRESLTKGEWLTSEVLTETLKQLSGAYTEADLIAQGFTKSQAKEIVELAKNATAAATEVKTVTQLLDTMKESVQSGWAQSWEYIIGDKEQATKTLTSIKDAFDAMIKPSTDARNEMLKFWNEAGGRTDVITGFTNIFQSIGKGLGAIGDAWREVFPAMTGKDLTALSAKFADFSKKLKMSDETAKKIKDTFKGVFDVFDTVKDSVVKLISGFTPLTGVFKSIGGIALDAGAGIGRFASNISKAIDESKLFDSIASGLKNSFNWIGDTINSVREGFSVLFDYIGNLDFSKAFSSIGKVFSNVGSMLKPLFDGLGKALGKFDFMTIMKAFQGAAMIETLKTLKGIFTEVGNVAEEAKGVFTSLKGIGGKIKGTLDSAREALEAWQQNLQASTLLKIAGAIGVLAGSLWLLASIDMKKMFTGLAGMGAIFAELALAYGYIAKVGGIKGGIGVSASLISMSIAIGILSGALKLLSTIEIGDMVTALAGLAVSMGAMVAAVKLFDTKAKNLKKTAASLVIFGVALMTMAGALKLLGSIDAETLGAGLFAMAGVLAELGIFLAAAKYGDLSMTTAAGVLILSAALVVLSQALKLMGNLDTDTIIKGLAGMAGVLTEVAIFSKFSGSGLNMVATAAGLAAMSAAMLVMSAALKSLGAIQWDEMARGLVAMAGGLTILGVASALISGGQMALLGVGIGVMSAALLVLSAALQSMGGMSWEEIGKGLLVLAGALTILGVAMYAMSGALLGAAAMVVMAGALALLTPQLLLLGQMDLAGVGIALLALAGAFTVIGLAGLILTPVVPTLLLLAAAIALLGVGCVACGAGLTAVGTGLGLIAAAVGGGGLLIVEFLRQLINLLPQLGQKAAEGFANFLGALTTATPQLIAGFTAIITAMLTAIGTMIPQIAQTGIDIVIALAQGLATAIPQLVTAGMDLILGVLEGIASSIGDVVSAAADVVINFINGIAAELPGVIDAGINLALSFIEGVADGISNNQARLQSAVEKVINAVVDAALAILNGAISGFVTGGTKLVQGLIQGIESLVTGVITASKNLITSAVKAVGNCGKALYSAGCDLVNGLISGITSMAKSVASKAKSVVEGAITAAKNALKINSPSKVFISIGKSVDEGFIDGMAAWSGKVNNSASDLANGAINNFSDTMSNISKVFTDNVDTNPVIAPVMDLTNVKNGARQLNGMLPNGMQINGRSSLLASSIGTIQNGTGNADVVAALKDLKDNLNNNGPSYNINGITYDDGSNVVNAVETLVRAARIERRI